MAATLIIELTETATNQTTNQSTVKCVIKVSSSGGSYNNTGPSGSVTFGGNASGTYSFTHNFSANTITTLYTRTFTVTHNSDGTGQVTASASFNTEVSPGTITASKTLTLKKIPRASSFSVDGPMTFASTLTFNINRASSSFTHLVQVSMGGSKVFEQGSVATSCQWSIPDNLSPGDADHREALATVTTYSGGTIIGSTTQSFNIYVSDQNRPAINSVTVIDNNGYYDDYGVYLANLSDLSVSISATAYSNASIDHYFARLGDNENVESNLNVVDIGSPNLTGTVPITAGCYDTRGRANNGQRNITVERAVAPQLYVYAFRAASSSSNVEDDEGNYIRIHVTGSTTRPGTKGTNTATVVVKYRRQGVSSWTTLNSANRGSTWDYYVYFSGSASYTYEIEVTATDTIGQDSTQTFTIGTAEPILDFKAGGEGLGMFTVSDVDGIKMGKPIYLPEGALTIYSWNTSNDEYLEGATFGSQGSLTIPGTFSSGDIIAGNVAAFGSGLRFQAVTTGGIEAFEFGTDSTGHPILYWGTPSTTKPIGGDMGRTLYTNSSGWNSGSDIITDAKKYRVFIIHNTSNSQEAMIGIRTNGNYICMFGAISQSDNYMYLNAAHFSTSTAEFGGPTDETWTRIYPRCFQLSPTRNVGTQATAILAIYRVIGVI